MRLRTWVKRQGRGAITRLAEATGLTYQTVWNHVHEKCANGAERPTAKLISAATGGAVSIDELEEPRCARKPRSRAA